jgi:hypothetical protein
MSNQQSVPKMGTKVAAEVSQRFMDADLLKSMLLEFYACPICDAVAPLDSVNQEMNNGKLWTTWRLACGDRFPSIGVIPRAVVKMKEPYRAFVTAEIHDTAGNLVSRLVQRSHSYVANMMQWMNYMLAAAGCAQAAQNSGPVALNSQTGLSSPSFLVPISNTSTYGASITATSVPALLVNDVANDATYGIQVGTLGNSPNSGDAILGAAVANGTGAGQLSYGAVTVNSVIKSGAVTSFNIVRPFTNNSAAAIIVPELGLIASTAGSHNTSQSAASTGTFAGFVMMAHDLFAAAQTINVGFTLTVTYTLQTST